MPTLEEERLAAERLAEARKETQEQQFARKEAREIKVEKIEVLEDIVQEQRSEALNAAAEANRASIDKKEGHKEANAFDYSKDKKKEDGMEVVIGGYGYQRPVDEKAALEVIQKDLSKANANCRGLLGDPLPQAEASFTDMSATVTLGEHSVKILNDEHGRASYECLAQENSGIIAEAFVRTAMMYNLTEMAQAVNVDFQVSRSVVESLTGEGSRAEAKNGLRDVAMAVAAAAMEKPVTVNGKEFNVGCQEFKDMRTELMAVRAKDAVLSELLANKGNHGLKPTLTPAPKPVELTPQPVVVPAPALVSAPKDVGQDIADAVVKDKKEAVLTQQLEQGQSEVKSKDEDQDIVRAEVKDKKEAELTQTSENGQSDVKPASSPVVEKAREAVGVAKLQEDSVKQTEAKAVQETTSSAPKAGGSST